MTSRPICQTALLQSYMSCRSGLVQLEPMKVPESLLILLASSFLIARQAGDAKVIHVVGSTLGARVEVFDRHLVEGEVTSAPKASVPIQPTELHNLTGLLLGVSSS